MKSREPVGTPIPLRHVDVLIFPVYRIVKSRFVNKIRAYARVHAVDKKYQQVFVLLLRLRQLTGHILLLQKTLRELLEGEDLERLWKLTDREGKPGEEGHDLLMMLQQGLANLQANPRPNSEVLESGPACIVDDVLAMAKRDDQQDATSYSGPAFKFRRYLKSLREDGRWEKIAQASLCHACDTVPKNPHITSCMHVYCYECLLAIAYAAAQEESIKAKCMECGTEYENVEPCRGFEEAGREEGTPASVRSAVRKRKKSGDDEEEDAGKLLRPPIVSLSLVSATQSILTGNARLVHC